MRALALHLALVAAATVAALRFGPACAASGPLGSLAFQGCLRDSTSTSPCTTVGMGLKQGTSVVVSPDGTFVYSTAWATTGAVNVFQRAANGQLTQLDSVGGTALGRTSGIAISADGASLYVASYNSSSLTVFRASPGAPLQQIECFSENAILGCAQVPSLAGAFGVALSPDGKNLYVASLVDGTTGGTLGIFQRQTDGILTFGSCYKQSGSAGDGTCTETAGLIGATRLAVSPDGANVYLAAGGGSGASGNLVTFSRNSDGSLLPMGCFRELGSTGADTCTPIPGLKGSAAVAVSGDGANVYAVGFNSGSIATFARGAGGVLTPLGCLREAGAPGDAACTPIDGLSGVNAVTVSADGDTVYATGEGSFIGVLLRGPGGQLTPSTCLRDVTRSNDPSCTQAIGLAGPEALALSPDGTSAYVATFFGGEVASFVRQVAPTCSDASISATGGAPVSIPISCSDPNGDPVTAGVVAAPAHGTVSGPDAGGAFTYAGALGYAGSDAFTFQASDGAATSHVHTVTIAVSPSTPAVTDFVATPTRFRPGRAAASSLTRSARGTTFHFTLSEASTTTIDVASVQKGRLDDGVCVKPTAKLRKATHCTRLVSAGTLVQPNGAGPNQAFFTGRFDGKALRPGRYQATITATNDPGRTSSPQSTGIKIVK